MLPGTGVAATNYTQPASILTIPRPATIKNLRVTAGTTPSGTSNTFTLYKNGSSTGLTATLTNPAVSTSDTTHVVNCNTGDTINMVLVTGTANAAANIVASVELY